MKRINQKAMQTEPAAKPKGNMQLFGCFFVKLGFIALTISVTFLWPHKKVTKEGGTGEALKVALPRAPYALPYEPHPSALGLLGGT